MLRAAGHSESTDSRRERGCARLEVVTHVPDRAVVRRVDRGLGVVFPAQSVGLRGFALCQDDFAEAQLTEWIRRASSSESLTGGHAGPAERVDDADVAKPVHR